MEKTNIVRFLFWYISYDFRILVRLPRSCWMSSVRSIQSFISLYSYYSGRYLFGYIEFTLIYKHLQQEQPLFYFSTMGKKQKAISYFVHKARNSFSVFKRFPSSRLFAFLFCQVELFIVASLIEILLTQRVCCCLPVTGTIPVNIQSGI